MTDVAATGQALPTAAASFKLLMDSDLSSLQLSEPPLYLQFSIQEREWFVFLGLLWHYYSLPKEERPTSRTQKNLSPGLRYDATVTHFQLRIDTGLDSVDKITLDTYIERDAEAQANKKKHN